MARCIKKYNCQNNGEMIMSQINTYLIAQGYTYKNYDGEMIYHKGNGWLSNPRCFKIQRIDECITIEGWMKWSLLPFVAVGEIDYSENSFLGAIPRKLMQTDAAGIERIIEQHSYANAQNSGGWSAQWSDIAAKQDAPKRENVSYQNNPMQVFEKGVDSTERTMGFDSISEDSTEQTVGFDRGSVDSTEQTMGFDSSFPRKTANDGVRVITKKEYIKNYADEKSIKDIKKAAIVGYVCSGITAVLGFVMVNIGVIVEVLIMIGLLLGMHLGRKKWCAMTYLIIAILDCVVSMAFTGSPSGWLIIVAGIWAVNTFNKIDKAYRVFKDNGYKKTEEKPVEWNF